jgi:hypothetical protein
MIVAVLAAWRVSRKSRSLGVDIEVAESQSRNYRFGVREWSAARRI